MVKSILLLVIAIILFNVKSALGEPEQHGAPVPDALIEANALTARNKNIYAPPPPPVRNIAEFEPVEGVLIRHPLGIPYTLIKEMAKDVVVYCGTSNPSSAENAFSQQGINMDNVKFINTGLESIWTRDYGPWWVTDGNGKVSIVDPIYYRTYQTNNDNFPATVGNELGVPVYSFDLQFAGGNYMTDGYGISASTNQTWDKNPGFTEQQIYDRMEEYLGITKYDVIDDPLNTSYEIDHIDTWGKFLAPDKIMLLQLPTSHQDYNKVEAVVDFFKGETSSYGTPYKIYRVLGGRSNEGYTNCLILNHKVLVPISGTSNDDAALEAYRKAMPGYTILGFRPSSNSWQEIDALHCRTMGIADRGMLYIGHLPLHDTVTSINGSGYPLEATIKAFSNESLISDSLRIYYRKAADTLSSYSFVTLEKSTGDTFKAVIPPQAEGYLMAYYVHAADESGRIENQPYIGAKDPFLFYAGTDGVVENVTVHSEHHKKVMITRKSYRKFIITIACDKANELRDSEVSIHSCNGTLIRQWTTLPYNASILWNGISESGQPVAPGVYFCVVKSRHHFIAKKFIF